MQRNSKNCRKAPEIHLFVYSSFGVALFERYWFMN